MDETWDFLEQTIAYAADSRSTIKYTFSFVLFDFFRCFSSFVRAPHLQGQVAGGEGDDQDTPLHKLSVRALHRLCLYRAINQLQVELGALARGETIPASADTATATATTVARVALAPPAAAAASEWLSEFSADWLPRLKEGAHDEVRARLGVAAPGEYKKLGLDGVDAAEALEKIWQARPPSRSDEAPEWFDPPALATRLYELRAQEAMAAAAAAEAFQSKARAGAY